MWKPYLSTRKAGTTVLQLGITKGNVFTVCATIAKQVQRSRGVVWRRLNSLTLWNERRRATERHHRDTAVSLTKAWCSPGTILRRNAPYNHRLWPPSNFSSRSKLNWHTPYLNRNGTPSAVNVTSINFCSAADPIWFIWAPKSRSFGWKIISLIKPSISENVRTLMLMLSAKLQADWLFNLKILAFLYWFHNMEIYCTSAISVPSSQRSSSICPQWGSWQWLTSYC